MTSEKNNEMSVMNKLSELIDSRIQYTLEKCGNKTVVFEPISDEYWKECVRLFLAAAVFHLRETQAAPSYSDLCEFVRAARECDREKLDNIFLCGGSDGYKYYAAFLEKAGKCIVSIIIDAHIKLKKIYFDKRRIEEFEKIFKI